MSGKVKSYNLILFIFGQISSMLGNQILRFILSMYILDITGSASIFANIIALSMVPTIICSPFGGILCDRFNRKGIMVLLDLLSGLSVFAFLIAFSVNKNINYITLLLIVLSIIGSILTPAIQSTVPLIACDIKKTNVVVSQITSIISMISPALAGILYSFFKMELIIVLVCISFILTSILECFLKINNQEFTNCSHNFLEEIREVCSFLLNKGKDILYLIIYAGLISFLITGLINIGLPYLIKSVLSMSTTAFGFGESLNGVAAVIGSTCSVIIMKKLKYKNLYLLILGVGISIGFIGVSTLSTSIVLVNYLIIIIFISVIQFLISIFSVTSLSIIMEKTPNGLLGRTLSIVATLTMCLQPFGQIVYGVGLSYSNIRNFIFLGIMSFVTITVSIFSKKIFNNYF
jgi:MFS family permease